jgi:protease I
VVALRAASGAEMKVAILVEDLYEDLELWVPLFRLREAGHAPVLVGRRRGRPTLPSTAIPPRRSWRPRMPAPPTSPGVVIPGGYAPIACGAIPAWWSWCGS